MCYVLKRYIPINQRGKIKTQEQIQDQDQDIVLLDMSTDKNKKNLTVVSYNARIDKDKPPHKWETRAKYFVDNLMLYKPDVITIQEATFQHTTVLEQMLCPEYVLCGVYRSPKSVEANSVYVHKNLTIISQKTYAFQTKSELPLLCAPPFCQNMIPMNEKVEKYPRIFTHVVLKSPTNSQQTIHVMNTHFPTNLEMQVACAARLTKFIQQTIPSFDSLVLTGDFNSHYSPTDSTQPVPNIITACAFKDAHLGLDFSTYTEGFEDKIESKYHRLDFILYRNMKLVNSGMSHYRYKNLEDGKYYRPSDHELLYSVFALA
jgi:endonuclease/exonuclease/phosphatase family metal-dependent hydrolase